MCNRMSIKDVHPDKLTKELSENLKEVEEIDPPEWSNFVKTGKHKERPPQQSDWWYLRAGSILRKVFERGPIGVSRLRSYYGGRKKRGSSPEKFEKGSGKVIRRILQQLEEADLVEKIEGEGRKISPQGMSFLDNISNQIEAN